MLAGYSGYNVRILQLHIFMSLHHSDIHWHLEYVMKYNAKCLPVFNAFLSNHILKHDKCTDFILHKRITQLFYISINTVSLFVPVTPFQALLYSL